MRRPRHKMEVSTFPFLAVLLCAMGAMVLFLLVMDRRAKIVAKTKAREALEERVASRGKDDAARLAEWERQREALHQALLDQQSELHGQTGEVRQLLADSRHKLHAKHAEGDKVKEATALVSISLQKSKAALTAKEIGLQKAAEKESVARSELIRLGADVRGLEQALADLQALKKRERQTFSLVPYRGKRGDNRNPIYIECAADGLIFHPEHTTLTRAQLTPIQLRSEVERRAGRLEREQAKAKEETPEPAPPRGPYVLFLIRPDGITNYYHALGMLKGYEIDFGYEVVDQHWVLDFNAPVALAGAALGSSAAGGTAKPAIPLPIRPASPRTYPSALPIAGNLSTGSSPLGGLGAGPYSPPVSGSSVKVGSPGATSSAAGRTGSTGNGTALGGFGAGGGTGGPPGSRRPTGAGGLPSPFQEVGAGGTDAQYQQGTGTGDDLPRLIAIGKLPPPVSLVKAGPGLPIGGVAATPGPISAAVGLVGSALSPGTGPNGATGIAGGVAGLPGQVRGTGNFTGQGTGSQPGSTGTGPAAVAGAPTGLPGQGPGSRGAVAGQGPAPAVGTPGQPPGAPGQTAGTADGSPGPPSDVSGGSPGQPQETGSSTPGQPSAAPGGAGGMPAAPGQKSGAPAGPPAGTAPTESAGAGSARSFPASGSSGAGGVSDGSSTPDVLQPRSFGPTLPAGAKAPARPATPPLGVVLGNRDFVVTITCYSDHVTVFPGGKQHWWKGPNAATADDAVVKNVQGLIAGRQRSVRPGEPPYRPMVRFQLAPDGLSSFLRVYPHLVSLKVPMTRENLED